MRRQHLEPGDDTPFFAQCADSIEDLAREIGRLSGIRISSHWADYPAHHTLGRHHHGCGQLIFASSGVMKVETEDGVWVTPPQRAIWVPAFVEHDIRTTSAVSLRTLYIRSQSEDLLPHKCRAFEVSGLFRELLLKLMTVQVSQLDSFAAFEMMSLLLRELHEAPATPLNVPMPSDPRLVKLCNAILNDLSSDVDIEQLCHHYGLSARNVSRLFIKECGITFGAWKRQCKLLEALVQIGAGKSITSVALDLGYDSPSAFTYMFRRVMGIPPSQYFNMPSSLH